jgi:hypothetical protein
LCQSLLGIPKLLTLGTLMLRFGMTAFPRKKKSRTVCDMPHCVSSKVGEAAKLKSGSFLHHLWLSLEKAMSQPSFVTASTRIGEESVVATSDV